MIFCWFPIVVSDADVGIGRREAVPMTDVLLTAANAAARLPIFERFAARLLRLGISKVQASLTSFFFTFFLLSINVHPNDNAICLRPTRNSREDQEAFHKWVLVLLVFAHHFAFVGPSAFSMPMMLRHTQHQSFPRNVINIYLSPCSWPSSWELASLLQALLFVLIVFDAKPDTTSLDQAHQSS